jgi:hypothetical protein
LRRHPLGFGGGIGLASRGSACFDDRGNWRIIMAVPDIIAITEFTREDYPALYALAPNGGGMEKTFDEWKKFADETVAVALLKGAKVIRIRIKPDEFKSWLAAKGLKSDGRTRAVYCHEVASRMQRN